MPLEGLKNLLVFETAYVQDILINLTNSTKNYAEYFMNAPPPHPVGFVHAGRVRIFLLLIYANVFLTFFWKGVSVKNDKGLGRKKPWFTITAV